MCWPSIHAPPAPGLPRLKGAPAAPIAGFGALGLPEKLWFEGDLLNAPGKGWLAPTAGGTDGDLSTDLKCGGTYFLG